jgi:hypothetical protein
VLDEAFDEEIDAAKEAIESGENVVVASEPFGGRRTVVDEAVTEAGVRRVSVPSVSDEGVEIPDDGVCVVEGSRYLYTRRVGGFAPLERFAEDVTVSDATFVTSWNAYAWDYVRHAVDLGVLGDTVRVPKLDASQIARLLDSEYDVSEFGDDLNRVTADRKTSFHDSLPFGLGRLLEESSDNIFEKISAASSGNPGVARSVFEERSWDEENEDADLSYEDAFALRVALSKETVGRDVLRSVVEPDSLPRTLRNLSDAGFVETTDGSVSLRAESLVRVVSHLRRRRLVW